MCFLENGKLLDGLIGIGISLDGSGLRTFFPLLWLQFYLYFILSFRQE